MHLKSQTPASELFLYTTAAFEEMLVLYETRLRKKQSECRYLLDRGCRGETEDQGTIKINSSLSSLICKFENQGDSRKLHQAEVWEIVSTSLGKEVTFLETTSRSEE